MSKKQSLKDEADKVVRNIKRANRRKFNSEEKIRIVLAGLRARPFTTGMTVIYRAVMMLLRIKSLVQH